MIAFKAVIQFCRDNPLVVWMGAFLLLGFILVVGAMIMTM